MFGQFASRLASAALLLGGAAIVSFLLIRLVPGDPAVALLCNEADDAALAQLRHRLALDRTLVIQFAAWFVRVLSGDLGRSIESGRPVLSMLLSALGPTAILSATAMCVAIVLGIPGGVYMVTHRRSARASALSAFSFVGLSAPSFWLGLLLVLAFSIRLPLFPASGYVSPFESIGGQIWRLALPATTLAIPLSAAVMRMTRSAMLPALRAPHIRTALANGLPAGRVIWRHAVPSAFPSIMALLAIQAGQLLGGVVVTETVFSWPGVGKLTVDAVFARDYPLIQGAVLMSAFVFVLLASVADCLQSAFDPRVRLQ